MPNLSGIISGNDSGASECARGGCADCSESTWSYVVRHEAHPYHVRYDVATGIELIPPAEGRGLIEFGVVLISRVEFKKIVG